MYKIAVLKHTFTFRTKRQQGDMENVGFISLLRDRY
jgi:hypothetical protein